MLPAVGQGALGLECRRDDEATLTLLQPLDDWPTRQAVRAERSLLRGLGGGCLVPIGAATEVTDAMLSLRGAVFAVDGRSCVDGRISGSLAAAEDLGGQLAQDLWTRGADRLLGGEAGRR
jgi:hydroxymethylbilane synthase